MHLKKNTDLFLLPDQGNQALQPVSTQPLDDTHCLICLDATADTVLYQCGHLCMCYTCGLQLKNRGSNCPVCRAPIKDIMRVFKSGHTH